MDAAEIAAKLKEPFDPKDIEWRVQRAMKTVRGDKAIVLAYITSRAVQERLDDVFGIDGWRDHYERWGDKGVKCSLSVRIGDEWITKQDGADDTNIEATKGGISDALKRAAVKLGIGRYLYKLDESWVDVKERGDNYINTEVKSGGQKVQIKGYWDAPQLPAWALPNGYKQATPAQQPSQDRSQSQTEPPPQQQPAAPQRQAPATSDNVRPISGSKLSDKQVKRLYAIAGNAGWSHERLKETVKAKFGVEHLDEMTRQQYDAVCTALEGVAAELAGVAQ